jgi:hypothetical protein
MTRRGECSHPLKTRDTGWRPSSRRQRLSGGTMFGSMSQRSTSHHIVRFTHTGKLDESAPGMCVGC